MKSITGRETLEGVLRSLDTRLGRQERHTHNWAGGGGPSTGGGVTGQTIPSTDFNNALRLGHDGRFYVREAVVKDTPPLPMDYGYSDAEGLPFGAIWVQVP